MDPLSQLRDLHLPPAPGIWPPAPGWWLLAILGLVLLCTGMWLILQLWRKNAYRRAALAAVSDLETAGDKLMLEALKLVRQTVISANANSPLVTMSGPELAAFLDRHSGGEISRLLGYNDAASTSDLEGLLYSDRATALSPEQRQSLLVQIRLWIKKHPRETLC